MRKRNRNPCARSTATIEKRELASCAYPDSFFYSSLASEVPELLLKVESKSWIFAIVYAGEQIKSAPVVSIFVKDNHFELINELIKPDAKKRLSLGSAAAQAGVTYNIYRNQIG